MNQDDQHRDTGAHPTAMPRRSFLRRTAAGAVVLGTGGMAAGCTGKTAKFNPATKSWFKDIATNLGADLVVDWAKGGLKDLWATWKDGAAKAVQAQGDGYKYQGANGWCHAGPPVFFVGLSKQASTDPMNDGLLACVNGGKDSVLFPPWAWQAIAMYVQELTDGKSGDELARLQTLCALSLVPGGVRPDAGQGKAGTIGFLTYAARYGTVELGWIREPDATLSVHVTATGMPDANHRPTTKKFALPSSPA